MSIYLIVYGIRFHTRFTARRAVRVQSDTYVYTVWHEVLGLEFTAYISRRIIYAVQYTPYNSLHIVPDLISRRKAYIAVHCMAYSARRTFYVVHFTV